MGSFLVWVEVEEVDDEGDHVSDHSMMLNGGSLATFDTLDEAVAYGDRLQRVGGAVPIPEQLAPVTAKVVSTGPTSATLACGKCGEVDDFGVLSVCVDWGTASCVDGFVEYGKNLDTEPIVSELECRDCHATNLLPEGWTL